MIAWLLMQQIAVLFLMVGCGYLLVKVKLLCPEDSRILSVLSVYLIVPCTIVNAFQIDYTDEIRDGFLLALFAAILIHAVLFVTVEIAGKFLRFERVEKASLLYSNAGNLIIPLVTSVLGEEWIIYSSAFICVQTFFIWTHGQSLLRGETRIDPKKLFGNINVLATVIGLVFFLARIRLPHLLDQTVGNFAGLIGPVSMVMLGMVFAGVDIKSVFTGLRIYLIVFLKMILFPGICLIFLRFLGHACAVPNAHTILLISLLATITPSASLVTQMSQLYGANARYASAINVLTTIVCIVTMPLMVFVYML